MHRVQTTAGRRVFPPTSAGWIIWRTNQVPDRELIEPNPDDKRYVHRDERGRFNEVEDVGRSSAQDQKREAKTPSKSGRGDEGDRKR
jgi:hypothetical protein